MHILDLVKPRFFSYPGFVKFYFCAIAPWILFFTAFCCYFCRQMWDIGSTHTCLRRLLNKTRKWVCWRMTTPFAGDRNDWSKLQKRCGDWSKLQIALNSQGFVEFALIVAIAKSWRDWLGFANPPPPQHPPLSSVFMIPCRGSASFPVMSCKADHSGNKLLSQSLMPNLLHPCSRMLCFSLQCL